MPKGRPWYPRFPSDFILGTVHMDLETRGAYSTIIDLLNDRDRPIPDEPRFIAGFLNCSVRKWNAIRERLLADGKLTLNDRGEITNPRFDREHLGRAEQREFLAEKGREGGLKSAAMRAQRELELPLSSDLEAEESRENGARVKDKSCERPPAPKKNRRLAQAPPQPSRARKSPETRVLPSERTLAQPPRARARKPPGIDALLRAVQEAAGFFPTNAGHQARAREYVQAWADLGIDIVGLAIPIIEREIAHAPDKTTGSLARFDRDIRAEHAAARAAVKHPPPPAAPTLPAGADTDDPRLETIRHDLRRDCGARTYDGWLKPMRMSIDGTILLIALPSQFMADWVLTHFTDRFRLEASKHGFTEVRIGIAQPKGKPP